ncbi:hypothetical protein [Rheinheimera sp. NSM]|uniref:hypothetical protein n=1 Tax=Rheinheimera sp. NSM TaxID=3457884 RepID=UPI004035F74D
MQNLDLRSVAVCIQALEDAIRYYELLAQSETTDSDDYEECKYMYEVELSRLCELYSAAEQRGEAPTPLKKLLKSG